MLELNPPGPTIRPARLASHFPCAFARLVSAATGTVKDHPRCREAGSCTVCQQDLAEKIARELQRAADVVAGGSGRTNSHSWVHRDSRISVPGSAMMRLSKAMPSFSRLFPQKLSTEVELGHP